MIRCENSRHDLLGDHKMTLERHIMRILHAVLLALCVITGFAFVSGRLAYSQSIIGYDIQNAVEDGSFVGWDWNYNGTITSTGGSIVVTSPSGTVTAALANYTGGGGTLNDGHIGSEPDNTELFATAALPKITIYLDGTYAIQSINLESFSLYNAIPGNISQLNVAVGRRSANVLTTTTTDNGNNVSSSLINLGIFREFRGYQSCSI
jgi:hypothetical protein